MNRTSAAPCRRAEAAVGELATSVTAEFRSVSRLHLLNGNNGPANVDLNISHGSLLEK
jgi:hypothetical protein